MAEYGRFLRLRSRLRSYGYDNLNKDRGRE